MDNTLFNVGERVRIVHGNFSGVEGRVVSPLEQAESGGTIVLHGTSLLLPITIAAFIDGRAVSLRVPPELLEPVA